MPRSVARTVSETPLITYATRGMEPHRGFPQFTAAIPAIQKEHPHAVIAIAGENIVAYGSDAIRRIDWLERGLATSGIDRSRIVVLGRLPGDSQVAAPAQRRARLSDSAVRPLVVDAGGNGDSLPAGPLGHRTGREFAAPSTLS